MKKAKYDRVPVVEDTLGLSLATLLATSKKSKSSLLAITWDGAKGLVMIEPERMTVMFCGVTASAEIQAIPCLNDRLRPLMKCPRAHEGNFQTLYLRDGELACRHCHQLRYRSNLAASPDGRTRLARIKQLKKMGAEPGQWVIDRQPFKWRKRHAQLLTRLAGLNASHYLAVRSWLENH